MPAPDLSELLERRRAALEALPGVVGTAVAEDSIHVYITPAADRQRLEQDAQGLLGGAPVELIAMTAPEAHSD